LLSAGAAHEDVDDALLGLRIDLFTLQKIVDLVVAEPQCVFVGLRWIEAFQIRPEDAITR